MNFAAGEEIAELYTHENTILAVISNAHTPPDAPDFTINLKSYDIDESEFLQLFFSHSTNHFHINSSNAFSKMISLKDQQHISNANQLVPFNFNNIVLAKMAEKDALTNNSLTALSKMAAIKRTANIQSLAHVRGFQQALTWFEAIDLLISSNIITPSLNPLAVGEVRLTVQFIFVEPATNLSIAINYNYNVSIPGYNGVKNAEPSTFTYSKDESFSKKKPKKKTFAPVGKKPFVKMDDEVMSASSGSSSVHSAVMSSNSEGMSSNSSAMSSNGSGSYQTEADYDDESLSYRSMSNSIIQQIKMIQQESSSEGDNDSVADDNSSNDDLSSAKW
jgi:hypothetical protein